MIKPQESTMLSTMLSIFGNVRTARGVWNRRELLRLGGLAFAGCVPKAAAPALDAAPGFGRADAVIFLYMQGAPSHIDLWDPKPDALPEIRGEFRPIATR